MLSLFNVLEPLCSLPISVSGPSCASGWNDFLFRSGWGRSIWLSDVPDSTWPAGQRHCQPFPQVCPSPGAQAGCPPSTMVLPVATAHLSMRRTLGLPHMTVTGVPLLHSYFFYDCFTLEFLEPCVWRVQSHGLQVSTTPTSPASNPNSQMIQIQMRTVAPVSAE